MSSAWETAQQQSCSASCPRESQHPMPCSSSSVWRARSTGSKSADTGPIAVKQRVAAVSQMNKFILCLMVLLLFAMRSQCTLIVDLSDQPSIRASEHLLSTDLGLIIIEQAIQGTCFHTDKRQRFPHIAAVSKEISDLLVAPSANGPSTPRKSNKGISGDFSRSAAVVTRLIAAFRTQSAMDEPYPAPESARMEIIA